jgi:hypothetical protein
MFLKLTNILLDQKVFWRIKGFILRMKLKDKEKLNNPLKGWQILSAISSMVFYTVQWRTLARATQEART